METLEKIQSEEKGRKMLYETSALAQERPNKEQPDVKEDITPFNISEVEYSSLKKLLRTTAYAKRFIDKIRRKTNVGGNLTFKELMDAEVMWIKNLQEKSFMTDKKQLKIEYQRSQLNPRIDTDGIIRIHGRMTNADLPEERITPIFLPKKAYFTTLLIKDVHNQNFHAKISHTLAQIRSKYWLPQG